MWTLENAWRPDHIDRSMSADGFVNEMTAADFLGETVADVRDLVRRGVLDGSRKANGLFYASRESLVALFQRNAHLSQDELRLRRAYRSPGCVESRSIIEAHLKKEAEAEAAYMIRCGIPVELPAEQQPVMRDAPPQSVERSASEFLQKFGVRRP
jgi:hypothetical protein